MMFEKVFQLKEYAKEIQELLKEKKTEEAAHIKKEFDSLLADLFSQMQQIGIDDLRRPGTVINNVEELLEDRFGGLKKEEEEKRPQQYTPLVV
jgi:hypothetical protein